MTKYVFKSSYSNSSNDNLKLIRYYFYVFFEKLLYFILIVLTFILLYLGQSNRKIDFAIRDSVLYVSKPIYTIAELPFNLLFDFVSSVKNILLTNIINKDLAYENSKLRELYLESVDIKHENEKLKKILNFKDGLDNSYDFISSKVYSNSKTGNSNKFTVNIGKNDGVIEGALVIGTEKSIIGRIVNVRKNFSEVLLLNDILSRIPARTATTKERIIISGNNDNLLEVVYFNSKIPNIEENDLVFTAGDSEIIPDGFYIGKIKKIKDKYYVKMNDDVGDVFDVLVIVPIGNEITAP